MVYLNHCIADSIELHYVTADDFLRKLARYMFNYIVAKYGITLFQNTENGKYLPSLMKWHPCGPEKQWRLIACKYDCLTCIKLNVPRYCDYMITVLCFKFLLKSIYDPK